VTRSSYAKRAAASSDVATESVSEHDTAFDKLVRSAESDVDEISQVINPSRPTSMTGRPVNKSKP